MWCILPEVENHNLSCEIHGNSENRLNNMLFLISESEILKSEQNFSVHIDFLPNFGIPPFTPKKNLFILSLGGKTL